MTEPGSNDPRPSAPDGDDFAARLARAETARDTAKGGGGGALGERESKGLGLGFRIGVDFTAAVAVGLLIGYAVDRSFGSTPWAMVAFLFLGGAAGVMNVMRAMQGLGYAVGWGAKASPTQQQNKPPRRDADGR